MQEPPDTATPEHLQNARDLTQGVLDDIRQELAELQAQTTADSLHITAVIKHEKVTNTKLQHAKTRLQEMVYEASNRNAQLADIQTQLDTSQLELQEMTEQHADVTMQLASQAWQLLDSGSRLEKDHLELQKATTQLKKQEESRAATEAELEEVTRMLRQLTLQVQVSHQQLQLCHNQLQETRSRSQAANSQIQRAQAEARTFFCQLKAVRSQLQASQDIANLQLEDERKKARAQIHKIKADAEGRWHKAQQQAEDVLLGIREELEHEIAARDAEIQSLKDEDAELRWTAANTELRQTAQQLRSRLYEVRVSLFAKCCFLLCVSDHAMAAIQVTDRVWSCVLKVDMTNEAHPLLTALYDDIAKMSSV